jgi:hypothetical protein
LGVDFKPMADCKRRAAIPPLESFNQSGDFNEHDDAS